MPLTLTNPNPAAQVLLNPPADGWQAIPPLEQPTAGVLSLHEDYTHDATSPDGLTWLLRGPEHTLSDGRHNLRGYINLYLRTDGHVQATFTLQQTPPATIQIGSQAALRALADANLMPPHGQRANLWQRAWNTFDTPLEDDHLTEPFLHFPPGTPHDAVLTFFDEHSPQGVAALMYPAQPDSPADLRAVLTQARDALSSATDALDDASGALDAGESETYAYQKELEQARATLTLIDQTLGSGA